LPPRYRSDDAPGQLLLAGAVGDDRAQPVCDEERVGERAEAFGVPELGGPAAAGVQNREPFSDELDECVRLALVFGRDRDGKLERVGRRGQLQPERARRKR
jgi:hypothetical protein